MRTISPTDLRELAEHEVEQASLTGEDISLSAFLRATRQNEWVSAPKARAALETAIKARNYTCQECRGDGWVYDTGGRHECEESHCERGRLPVPEVVGEEVQEREVA